jgi:hypothetical protein
MLTRSQANALWERLRGFVVPDSSGRRHVQIPGPRYVDIVELFVAVSVTKPANPQTKYLTSMRLEKAFELYPEVHAKIFRLGVVMERTAGISS